MTNSAIAIRFLVQNFLSIGDRLQFRCDYDSNLPRSICGGEGRGLGRDVVRQAVLFTGFESRDLQHHVVDQRSRDATGGINIVEKNGEGNW